MKRKKRLENSQSEHVETTHKLEEKRLQEMENRLQETGRRLAIVEADGEGMKGAILMHEDVLKLHEEDLNLVRSIPNQII